MVSTTAKQQNQLERDQEGRRDFDRDHAGALGEVHHQRGRKEGVDLVRERKQHQEHDQDRQEHAQDPVAQFDQVTE
jgi:hypothetical protein